MITASRPYLIALLLGLALSAAVGLPGCGSKAEVGDEKIVPGDPGSDREAREGKVVPKK